LPGERPSEPGRGIVEPQEDAATDRKKILVYAYEIGPQERYRYHEYYNRFQKKEYTMEFTRSFTEHSDFRIPKAPAFGEFDIVVICGGNLLKKDRGRHDPLFKDEIVRRENEISVALEEGKILCFLFEKYDELAERILQQMGISRHITLSPVLRQGLTCRRSEFNEYMQFMKAESYYSGKGLDAIYLSGKKIMGFCRQVNKGMLLFLPYHRSYLATTEDEDYVVRFFNALAKPLASLPFARQPPQWIESEIKLPGEKEVEGKITDLNSQLSRFMEEEEEFSKTKSILHLEGIRLENLVRNLFRSMGYSVEQSSKFSEDFMIVDPQKKPIVLCEVKSSSKNVKEKHLVDVERHKLENDLTLDFPSVLIVNSFVGASSLREKNCAVPPKIVGQVKNGHVVIVRTLDLLWAFAGLKQGTLTKDGLLGLFRQSGWLRVYENGRVEMRDR
jgi:hypothetical protein